MRQSKPPRGRMAAQVQIKAQLKEDDSPFDSDANAEAIASGNKEYI